MTTIRVEDENGVNQLIHISSTDNEENGARVIQHVLTTAKHWELPDAHARIAGMLCRECGSDAQPALVSTAGTGRLIWIVDCGFGAERPQRVRLIPEWVYITYGDPELSWSEIPITDDGPFPWWSLEDFVALEWSPGFMEELLDRLDAVDPNESTAP